MANYGAFGDEEAISEAPAPRGPPEQRQDTVLKACGFKDGPREEEYNQWKREFAAHAIDCKMTEAAFVAHTGTQRWGIDAKTAVAAFRAADVDGSGMLNTHEYTLLRGALTAYNPERDDKTILYELRIRTLFSKYAGDPNKTMNALQRKYLLQDLCSGDSHIEEVVKQLGWPHDDSLGEMSCPEFLSAVKSKRLHRASLYTKDAFLNKSRASIHTIRQDEDDVHHNKTMPKLPHHVHKLVLDPRCVVADNSSTKSCAVGASLVNEKLVLDDSLRAPFGADWRGALAAPRGAQSQRIAADIVEIARDLAIDLARNEDEFELADSEWKNEPGEALSYLLGSDDPDEQMAFILDLAQDAKRVSAAQPIVARIATPPVKIFGDVHGQLRDLLLLLGFHGFPSHRGGDIESVSYVFNGDFVDRGAHQLEVVILLFALKVLYPARIILVRGNHEFKRQNEGMGNFGFQHQVFSHFKSRPDIAETIYDAIHETFDWLPLAAIVAEDSIFVVHGGIGDGSWSIDDLQTKVKRPLPDAFAPDVPACVRHALWSDPSDSDHDMARGVHFLARGDKGYRGSGIPKFGPDVTAAFCEREHIQLIVRSHQFIRSGVKFMHSGHLATVFSARNYFDAHSNDSALLLVALDEQGSLRVRAKRLAHICGTNNCDNQQDLIPA